MTHVRIEVVDGPEKLAEWGAAYVLDQLERRLNLLMCVATGSSPLGVYRALAAHYRETPERFRQLRVLKLDEWGPLGADDPASGEYYVRREIVEPLGIDCRRYFTLAGDAADPAAECARYAETLASVGPIDLAVLGIGTNGHLGLNEPAQWLHDGVHVAELAPESQGHGMLANARTRPTHGLTLGIGDILRSRRILVLVSGASKREPMSRFLTRQITPQFPASFLWTHSDVAIICDREAWPGP